ncbi:MAG: hypothetical protein ABSD49_03115, partial [Candidatus Bathyarchaeia archaeon]
MSVPPGVAGTCTILAIDFQLSIAISALVTGLLYVLTSFATIGTAIYVNQSLYAPVALMFSRSLGLSAVAITLFL